MGALPKNKITRAERGKRRRGNTPKLKKNPKSSHVLLSRQGLSESIIRRSGIK